MFRKVIAGVDGEAGGRDAIRLAHQLVADGGDVVEAHVQATSVGHGLHELAEEQGADLLVVGSTRHGVFGRMLIGDGTRETIDGTPCAVAVAPVGYAEKPREFKHMTVAYNGSPESKHALDVARRIADERNLTLSAIEVVPDPPPMYVGQPAVPLGEATALGNVATIELDAARKRLEALGGVEALTAIGSAPDALARHSHETDLLIVGSRELGPVGRLMRSSTSRYLAHHCHCPLLILPKTTTGSASDPGPTPASTPTPTDETTGVDPRQP